MDILEHNCRLVVWVNQCVEARNRWLVQIGHGKPLVRLSTSSSSDGVVLGHGPFCESGHDKEYLRGPGIEKEVERHAAS